MPSRPAPWLLALLLFGACSDTPAEPPAEAPNEADEAPPAPAAPAAEEGLLSIPAGVVRAGSPPGRAGRDAAHEADEVPLALGAFEIEALPYPGRPSVEAARVGSAEEAAALCAAAGQRLCEELEWERACELHPGRFASSEREWTASRAGAAFAERAGAAVVRGAEDAATRCGARALASSGARLPFRCCEGEAQRQRYPSEPERPTIEALTISAEEARAALAAVPELTAYAETFALFTEEEARGALSRGRVGPEVPNGFTQAPSAFAFSPAQGELVWVLAGRAGDDSLIALVYPLPEGRFAHAASMILAGDPVSVLLTYGPPAPRSIAWTSCYGCDGESGEIQYRSDARFVVVQR